MKKNKDRFKRIKDNNNIYEKFSNIKTGKILTLNQLAQKYNINFKEMNKK